MESRREFIKKASLLAGATAMVNMLPESIQRALAIDASAGSTYLDAEHIVFLMQENRSFDHCFGSMRGVRGFNDPRAMKLPNGLPVWFQTDQDNKSYAPFRLDIENTKTTWMGSLPHGWRDMVQARNNGKMDTWLDAKRPRNTAYRHLPLTLGYYNRQDIPFYYAFGDAFTVCDQHFCSSLTGTSANRSHFWSGTVREEPRDGDSTAHVDNGQINYRNVGWKTYPERLQEAGVEWKVYQNELSVPIGFDDDHEDWLANFTNNNLEFHKQYGVAFHPARRQYRTKRIPELETLLQEEQVDGDTRQKLAGELNRLLEEHRLYSKENYDRLTDFEKQIHQRALLTNTADPDYHSLETITYQDQEGVKPVQVPKGDIFYQFRKDVNEGRLPTVSWLVAPGIFSDHPVFPWYGAWYVSEALDILTKNPEVWKKTIFILNYDENDGYFDHVSPFVPPLTSRPESGAVASGIDTRDEYVTNDQEKLRTGNPETTLDSPIGLGFRVPLVVASPWSKGGWINSEVCDLTSPLMFLEHFLEHKTGKKILETNLSEWRRLVCGNLTSVFRPAEEHLAPTITPVDRNREVARIHAARNKDLPGNFQLLGPEDLEAIRDGSINPETLLPRQEKGTKPACALPYDVSANAFIRQGQKEKESTGGGELVTGGKLVTGRNSSLVIRFELGGKLSKTKTIGIPFIVISRAPYGAAQETGRTWNFAVREQEPLEYTWSLDQFVSGRYHLEVHGPNGFYREFKGSSTTKQNQSEKSFDAAAGPLSAVIELDAKIDQGTESVLLRCRSGASNSGKSGASNPGRAGVTNPNDSNHAFTVRQLSYQSNPPVHPLRGGQEMVIDLKSSFGWYDIEIVNESDPAFYQRYAGHIETGKTSQTDPLMGGVV